MMTVPRRPAVTGVTFAATPGAGRHRRVTAVTGQPGESPVVIAITTAGAAAP
ncbi:hypothetical protein [Oceanibacterium hippocampi]|uniref:Uncharacterized protein n=1 Tax=Oceanibacterium hippocampi TaxID=745714 RepID=A0A1Y5T0Z2_9PROT|nr:hypothetical protein [Oceanibacterium hippocampi]SLN49601.1 hypothetical protein OCH7691_02172 [Oceanibacterium hippocampi]